MIVGAPKGKLLYVRGDLLDPDALLRYLRAGKYNGAMVPPAVARRAASALKAAGFPFWLYTTPDGDGNPNTPDSWLPSQYARTIPAFEALALQLGARGYLADAETGWGSQPLSRAEEFGRALVESKQRTGLSVGVTTFYTHNIWRRIARIAGKDVWVSIQMYSERTAAENAAILSEVKGAGWSVHVPSVAAYRWVVVPNAPNYVRARTPEEWEAAYGKFPLVRGAIVWYALPAPSGELLATIAGWKKWLTVPLVLAGVAVVAALAAAVTLLVTKAATSDV